MPEKYMCKGKDESKSIFGGSPNGDAPKKKEGKKMGGKSGDSQYKMKAPADEKIRKGKY